MSLTVICCSKLHHYFGNGYARAIYSLVMEVTTANFVAVSADLDSVTIISTKGLGAEDQLVSRWEVATLA